MFKQEKPNLPRTSQMIFVGEGRDKNMTGGHLEQMAVKQATEVEKHLRDI